MKYESSSASGSSSNGEILDIAKTLDTEDIQTFVGMLEEMSEDDSLKLNLELCMVSPKI